ncbi:MAG: hypothetical protein EU539_01510 [Promethearchaeota archaeon]|nr:MAG: hypothetical protein EU539_01510 [Candidatus Lokiarchaeota archaeon]
MRNLKLKGLKYNRGKFSLFDDRILFFPPQLIDILSSIYGEGVKSLLVWLGKKEGWNLIQDWEENLKPKNLNELTNQFCTILSSQGWGLFEPKEISENNISIKLQHNISTELENKSKYFCYYIKGILSGFGEFSLYKVTVDEVECSLENDNLDSCVFEIKKSE